MKKLTTVAFCLAFLTSAFFVTEHRRLGESLQRESALQATLSATQQEREAFAKALVNIDQENKQLMEVLVTSIASETACAERLAELDKLTFASAK